MIVRLRRALEREPQQRRHPRREGVGKERIALEHAGVAVGGFLARPALVDQRDGDPALGELQRDRRADDAGAEHDHLRSSHGGASGMTAHM